MSLKQSPVNTNSQTIKQFKKFLINKKSSLFNDKVMREDLLKIKDLLVKIEDRDLQMRSTAAARKLAEMTEEERRAIPQKFSAAMAARDIDLLKDIMTADIDGACRERV